MTLKEAKTLRDYIIATNGVNCTVPLGCGPDNYFPRSILSDGPRVWRSRAEFRQWHAQRLRDQRKAVREYEALLARRQRRRSPIEMMVDRACGLG